MHNRQCTNRTCTWKKQKNSGEKTNNNTELTSSNKASPSLSTTEDSEAAEEAEEDELPLIPPISPSARLPFLLMATMTAW